LKNGNFHSQEVEEDAIAGYRWYEEKAKGWVRSSCGFFMPGLSKFSKIQWLMPGVLMIFEGICSDVTHMLFIIRLREIKS
jgi:hypothetical protein